MPTNYVPSAWDYLGQALGNEGLAGGIKQNRENAEKKKAIDAAQKAKDWQQQMELLQTMISGYSANGVGMDAVNAQAAKVGLPASFQPNQLDRRNIIESSPDGRFNPAAVQMPQAQIPQSMPGMGTMQQMLGAGGNPPPTPLSTAAIPSMGIVDKPQSPLASGMFKMPTADFSAPPKKLPWTDNELKMAGLPTELDKLKEHLDVGKHQAGLTYLNGGDISSRAASMLGVQTDRQLSFADQKSADPVLDSSAGRYVAEAISKIPGGRISTKNLDLVVNNGLDVANQYRKVSNLGPLAGADLAEQRSYIAAAARAALLEEEKMGIERMKAASMQDRGTKSPLATIESVRAHLDDLSADIYKQNMLLGIPGARTRPENADAFKKLDLIDQQKAALGRALVLGSLDKLSQKDQELLGQLAATQLGTQSAGPPSLGSEYTRALVSLQNKPARQALADIDAKVASGRLNATDAAQLKKDLGISP